MFLIFPARSLVQLELCSRPEIFHNLVLTQKTRKFQAKDLENLDSLWLTELCGDPQTSKQFSDRILAQLAEGSGTEKTEQQKKKRIKDILFGNPLEISVNFKNIDLLTAKYGDTHL